VGVARIAEQPPDVPLGVEELGCTEPAEPNAGANVEALDEESGEELSSKKLLPSSICFPFALVGQARAGRQT